MAFITRFLKQYNVTSHTFVVLWAALVGFYGSSPAFAQYVNHIIVAAYHALPHWAEEFVMGVVVSCIIYRKGLSTTGKQAIAAQVTATNTSPTGEKQ
jgi:hypothetical protein